MRKVKEIFKGILTSIKTNLKEIVRDTNNKITFEKLIVVFSLLNVTIQLALIVVHNKGGLKVSETVTIFSFIFIILLLLCFANSLRLKDGFKYYIYSFIFNVGSIVSGIYYIFVCLTDKNYQDAVAGTVNNPHLIQWPIEDSVVLMSVGVGFVVLILGLTIGQIVISNKRR